MAKNLLIASFLVCLLFGLIIFWSKKEQNLLDNIEGSSANEKPRIQLTDFSLRRYHEDRETLYLSAKSGQVLAPNRVVLEDDVYTWRISDGKKHSIKADQISLEFNTKDLANLSNQAEIKHASLKGKVLIYTGSYQMTTPDCQYDAEGQLFYGSEEVLIKNDRQWLSSTEGFNYSLISEELLLFGLVKGELKPSGTP